MLSAIHLFDHSVFNNFISLTFRKTKGDRQQRDRVHLALCPSLGVFPSQTFNLPEVQFHIQSIEHLISATAKATKFNQRSRYGDMSTECDRGKSKGQKWCNPV